MTNVSLLLNCCGAALKKRTIWIPVLVTLFTAVVPVCRAFFKLELNYNEGWNVYNAQAVAQHQLLYPVRYGWTTVNYPMLSFWVMAQLHRLTHDYLFTGRAVSLLSLVCSACLVGAIIRLLGASRGAALLGALFCWAIFCADADAYVGVDDPQLMAQAVFLLGLCLYLRNRRSGWNVSLAAFVFVVALFIKHNPIDFPLAVLIDLALLSMPLAVLFLGSMAIFVAIAVALTNHVGGPFFAAELLSPRRYAFADIPMKVVIVLGPVLLPLLAAGRTAWAERRDSERRIAGILLGLSILFGSYFSGGSGVSINVLFSTLVAISVLLGLFFDELSSWGKFIGGQPRRVPGTAIPAVCFVWLAIPLVLSGDWNPLQRLREARAGRQRFLEDVAALEAHKGPTLCESLLECYAAGKPYVYDPFNATRFIHFHELDAGPMLQALQEQHFAAIQTDAPLSGSSSLEDDRFDPAIQAAIRANYTSITEHPATRQRLDGGAGEGSATELYVPRDIFHKPSVQTAQVR